MIESLIDEFLDLHDANDWHEGDRERHDELKQQILENADIVERLDVEIKNLNDLLLKEKKNLYKQYPEDSDEMNLKAFYSFFEEEIEQVDLLEHIRGIRNE